MQVLFAVLVAPAGGSGKMGEEKKIKKKKE